MGYDTLTMGVQTVPSLEIWRMERGRLFRAVENRSAIVFICFILVCVYCNSLIEVMLWESTYLTMHLLHKVPDYR